MCTPKQFTIPLHTFLALKNIFACTTSIENLFCPLSLNVSPFSPKISLTPFNHDFSFPFHSFFLHTLFCNLNFIYSFHMTKSLQCNLLLFHFFFNPHLFRIPSFVMLALLIFPHIYFKTDNSQPVLLTLIYSQRYVTLHFI